MKLHLIPLLIFIFSCSTPEIANDPFEGKSGCFLLFNLKTGQLEKKLGKTCEERFPACSTFKVPLAAMSFDSGVLKDENEVFKWDGKKRVMEDWNMDQNAQTWMRFSVVWFSQRLTPKMGKKKLQRYLNDFNYGNQDISSGLTTAWINRPYNPAGYLGISPLEQLEFMKKLWTHKLPVSQRAMRLTREITYMRTSPKGFKISGKTGSSSYDKENKVQLGWFISHVAGHDKDYLAITQFRDLTPAVTDSYGGHRARDLTYELLEQESLW